MPATASSTVLERLEGDGYVLVEDVFDPQRDFEPVIRDFAETLDRLADTLLAEGAIDRTYAGLPFRQRLVEVCRASGTTYSQHFDISLPQSTLTAETPLHLPDSIYRILTHDRLLDVIEEIVGGEITANPVQHIRMKLPRGTVERTQATWDGLAEKVSWHQDNAVMLPEADEARIVSVWFPFGEATRENGCLRVVPGSHRDGMAEHCPRDTGVSIPERVVLEHGDAVELPMAPGSVLIFDQRLMHESLENTTAADVRISADLRFQRTGEPTGRPMFPPLVVRSSTDPSSVGDPDSWRASWLDARDVLLGKQTAVFNRWSTDSPACA
jgi:phytanoyl-CoA hydroxylase